MSEERADRKIQEICDIITKETLTPAKEKADLIIEDAKKEAAEIIREANEERNRLIEKTRQEIEKEKRVADSSIELAVKQALSRLRSSIHSLFSAELKDMFKSGLKSSDIVAKVINSVVSAIESKGVKTSLTAQVSKDLDLKEVQSALLENVKKSLGSEGVQLSELPSGVVIKQTEKSFAVEVSDKALIEMLGEYLTDNLQEKLFSKS